MLEQVLRVSHVGLVENFPTRPSLKFIFVCYAIMEFLETEVRASKARAILHFPTLRMTQYRRSTHRYYNYFSIDGG